jgi:hypothetical protein
VPASIRRAYIAQAVLTAAATDGPLSGREALRQVLIELMRAAGLVRRIGTNINQAVANLNATGQPAGDLPGYATRTIRCTGRSSAPRSRCPRPGGTESAARFPSGIRG